MLQGSQGQGQVKDQLCFLQRAGLGCKRAWRRRALLGLGAGDRQIAAREVCASGRAASRKRHLNLCMCQAAKGGRR